VPGEPANIGGLQLAVDTGLSLAEQVLEKEFDFVHWK
jgi:hypothetical protein